LKLRGEVRDLDNGGGGGGRFVIKNKKKFLGQGRDRKETAPVF